jgi:hypothetical protein
MEMPTPQSDHTPLGWRRALTALETFPQETGFLRRCGPRYPRGAAPIFLALAPLRLRPRRSGKRVDAAQAERLYLPSCSTRLKSTILDRG